MTKNIAVFGGTFDPIHFGHTDMIKYLVNNNYVDELWVMPSYFSPHKQIDTINTYNDRVEMIKLATKGLKNVIVSTFEEEYYNINKEKTYTYEVLNALKKKFKDFEFSFIVGFDSIFNINTWHNYISLLNEFKFYIFDRNDSGFMNFEQKKQFIDELCKSLKVNFKYEIFDTNITNISSTEIRELAKDISKNKSILLKYVDPNVLKYIEEKRIYV